MTNGEKEAYKLGAEKMRSMCAALMESCIVGDGNHKDKYDLALDFAFKAASKHIRAVETPTPVERL